MDVDNTVAEEVTTEPVVKKTTAKKKKETAKVEPKFKIAKLRTGCLQLFGITRSTFDGAMYGVEAEELTVEETRAIINKWLGKE